MLTPTFTLLLREAQFTREMLGTGATQIRRANYASQGIYFQAFTSLATGLERIGKLCILLDFFIESRGNFPPASHTTRFGHRLLALYDRSQEIVKQRSLSLKLTYDLSDPMHAAVVHVLHGFAMGDRYANIDLLGGSRSVGNPIAKWFAEVDTPLFDSSVSARKKLKVSENARFVGQLMSPFSSVLFSTEMGEGLTGIQEASERSGMWEAVAPYRQLAVLQVIRYWTELVGELGHLAQALPGEDIPHFAEIFAIFQNDDSYLKSRKSWEKP